ncbi:phosphate starvation-inducible protein PsiF [Pigmentiphaga litoralis]|jgi:hypothetical protein|uniref:PsiF family protein n=1 Tax=Pigmentiphaga litoralis TaxID=516702 RepID=UPI0019AB197A|nr:phosphate starvation-inducible protein PsiF [Pigmentiphaga litoralis]
MKRYLAKGVKRGLMAGALFSAMLAGPVLAQTAGTADPAAKPKTAQQTKMAECNVEAKGKKGDEYKGFMSQCLKAKPMTSQERMASCSKQGAGRKGDDYKNFVSTCMKAG